jgi:hypothetical protein
MPSDKMAFTYRGYMCALFNWVKSATERIFDPKRDERIRAIANEVEATLFAEKAKFDFDATINGLGVLPEDVRPVAERIYKRALRRVYSVLGVSDRQKDGLQRLAQTLKIDAGDAHSIEHDVLLGIIQRTIETSSKAGRLSESEEKLIIQSSHLAGVPAIQWLELFRSEIAQCLATAFAFVASKDEIDQAAWTNFIDVSQFFCCNPAYVCQAIDKGARAWVEHILRAAIQSRAPSQQHLDSLKWILTNVPLDNSLHSYLTDELGELNLLAGLAQGKLPSAKCTNVELHAGEIAHVQTSATYFVVRRRQSGDQTESFAGVATITDYRFIFVSPIKTFEITHTRIVDVLPTTDGMELRTTGHGDGYYSLPPKNAQLIVRIFQTAIRKSYQTVTEHQDELPARYISREIRQRVWQRYGGRCAECGSDQYLEFDHIIPVAKGGSNSEENVELLCRRCNSKKSDKI